jgi:hypothetical protein
MIQQPDEVKERLRRRRDGNKWLASAKQMGLAAHLLESVWPESKTATQNRRTVLKWLFEEDSLRLLYRSEVGAIIEWLSDGKDEDTGRYMLNPEAAEEARLILRRALEDAGQMRLF